MPELAYLKSLIAFYADVNGLPRLRSHSHQCIDLRCKSSEEKHEICKL